MAPEQKKRRQCTWKDRWELREAYAFVGTVAGALDAVNAAHAKQRDWVPLTYAHADKAKKHDARLGPVEDWDVQAPNIRRRFIEESEKRLGKRAIDITEKLLDRAEDTVDHPSYRIKGSVATEIEKSVKTTLLLAGKPTQITDLRGLPTAWASLSPEEQRSLLVEWGVDVSKLDAEADSMGSGNVVDGAEDENPSG